MDYISEICTLEYQGDTYSFKEINGQTRIYDPDGDYLFSLNFEIIPGVEDRIIDFLIIYHIGLTTGNDVGKNNKIREIKTALDIN